MPGEPTMMQCEWCGKSFPADARACIEAGVSAVHEVEEGEEWKGEQPSTISPDQLTADQREYLKEQLGLNDKQLEELLTTGDVHGLGAIVCLQCQDEALKQSEQD